MQEEKFKIDILKDYKERFKQHLNLDGNYRTIFSGSFGIGKTTFIKDFFSIPANKESYEVLHLFPVNYSIASNEDIFELIKYDILYRLLQKNIQYEITDIDLSVTAFQFIKDNFIQVILPFMNLLPNIGGDMQDVAQKCLELKNKLDTYNSEINTNELEQLENFLNEFSKKKGTIYENDFYTKLIINLIGKLQENDRKVVLIIDDLDRIDPEHIFRLLNIFSAHTDILGDETHFNKFDFDKVIFVCDIENIRNIYRSKFGIKTDFNGYIDKFYSKSIFQFKINDVLLKFQDVIVQKMKFSEDAKHGASSLKYRSEFSENFLFVLKFLFFNNKLSLRDLSRVCNITYTLDFDIYTLNKLGLSGYHSSDFSIVQLYDIFLLFYGNDKVKLLDAFSNTQYNFHQERNLEYFVQDIFLFLYLNENPKTNFDNNKSFSVNFRNVSIQITESNYRSINLKFLDIEQLNKLNYDKLIFDSFEIIATKI